jgi:hypothetical protein
MCARGRSLRVDGPARPGAPREPPSAPSHRRGRAGRRGRRAFSARLARRSLADRPWARLARRNRRGSEPGDRPAGLGFRGEEATVACRAPSRSRFSHQPSPAPESDRTASRTHGHTAVCTWRHENTAASGLAASASASTAFSAAPTPTGAWGTTSSAAGGAPPAPTAAAATDPPATASTSPAAGPSVSGPAARGS